MTRSRLSLFKYDLVRELCPGCSAERFHFVPKGEPASPALCKTCGNERRVADLSDTSIIRLVTGPSGEMVIVPLVEKP